MPMWVLSVSPSAGFSLRRLSVCLGSACHHLISLIVLCECFLPAPWKGALSPHDRVSGGLRLMWTQRYP